ncbi:MAG TPA: DUF2798 domain-containing protein [Bacteroidia bacterium]|nr:DUF2798 domain-containing protein [Bacteroidia bacterium]
MKHKIAFALIMGIITTCIISFTLVAVNVGFGPIFIKTWLRSWCIAYSIIIPSMLIIAPKIQKLVVYILDDKD